MGKITLENIQKSFGTTKVLHGIDLEVKDGEFVVFVGPSGCGKSTLLRAITGLEEINGGRILIDGEDVSHLKPSERHLAMVFQSYALFPHISVRDNISFGLKVAKVPKPEISNKVAEAARILSLEDYLDRYPRELSGGQRQRVAIGRAIVRDPTAFLFDEPLSNLDAALRVQMRIELIKLRNTLKTTMIYVTHDQVEAMTMADKIAVLNGGNLEQYASPLELYNYPKNVFVATFIGSPRMNILPMSSSDVDTLILHSSDQADNPRLTKEMRKAASLGIRPEHIVCSTAEGLWQGTVELVEQLGSDAFFYVDVTGVDQLIVRDVGQRDIKNGDTVFLTPMKDKLHLFDESGERIG